jgi:hypothetical protein
LLIECDVGDAAVWVNDHQVGLIADLAGGVVLAPGMHRLEIRHDHYHTHYAELSLAARARVHLPVRLAAILP